MIPKTAFAALAALAAVFWAFGAVCDKLITKWSEGHTEPNNEPEKRSCDNCKHEHTNPSESPCKECADDDIDMWEPCDK